MKKEKVRNEIAKELVHRLGITPSNILTPKALAKEFDSYHSVSEDKIGIYSVGSGEGYMGRSTIKRSDKVKELFIDGVVKERKIAVVGKGITFDTGGISIKSDYNMHQMKFDMLGCATALSLKHTLKDHAIDVEIIGCIAENIITDKSNRPGDVINYSNGTKVEIVNTHALV